MKVKDLVRKLTSLNDIGDYTFNVAIDPCRYQTNMAYDSLGTKAVRVAIFDETKEVIITFERGLSYVKGLGQYQRAIEDFDKAIRLQPDLAEAYYNRGIAYLLQGKSNLGCRDAQKACALGDCQLLEGAKREGSCR